MRPLQLTYTRRDFLGTASAELWQRLENRANFSQAKQEWFPPADASVLAEPIQGLRQDRLLERITPMGISEQALLIVINQGNIAALESLRGVGPAIARNLIAFRRRERLLSSIDELVRIRGIGPKHFEELVGRSSMFERYWLHFLLRWPWEKPIFLRDLMPLEWAAPGLPRLTLASSEQRVAERAFAQEHNYHLLQRKVTDAFQLYFQFQSKPSGWASFILKMLPTALNRTLSQHERTPA